jgi:serine/threonine-protein kinase
MQQESAKLGRYRLVERLAAGGMAEVYLARMQSDGGLEKTVVVKTILPELTANEDMRKMMLDEARIGFALRHQNIAQVLDVGREGDTLYVAIEHIDGMDLARLQRACESQAIEIDPMLAVYVGVEVLRALDYAHRRRNEAGEELQIVHRDISPHNVLLSVEGEVKLTDFGIARATDRLSRTNTGGTKGKLAYMAPEQARGKLVDQRADLFGVAATLYELLCGVPPYEGRSDLELLRAVERGEIRPLRDRRPDLDALLAGVIDRGLSVEPDDRPGSAAEMRRPLEELLLGHAVAAEQLAALVGRAREGERARASQDAAFQRAILGAGTGTGAASSAGMAAGTPTMPTLAARSGTMRASEDMPVGGARGRFGWIAGGLVAVAAVVVVVVLAVGGGHGESAAPTVAPSTSTSTSTSTSKDAAPVAVPAKPEADAAPATTTATATRGKKKKRKRKKVVGTGTVTITSLPWARVAIDGRYVGDTPLKRKKLPVGKHKVRLANPETGQSATRTVEIEAGEHSTLRLKL